MSGIWLASYIVLWGIVIFQGVAIFVLLRQLGIMYLGTAQGVARDGLAPSTKAPEFALSDLDGRPVTLADRLGMPLVMVFGSTTCGPCRQLMPDLQRFAADRRDALRVLFLCRGSAEEARRFASELDVQVPVAVLPDEALAEQYKVRVTPFGFLIDAEGVVRAKGLTNNYSHLEMLERMASEGYQSKRGRNGTSHPAERAEEVR
jgi:methylamine dehydrogenase accessory protein MauD